MTKTRILISESTNPWFNLAVEDTIFRSMPADQRVLFLWRNADTVVIGRAQNPWRECRTERMEQDRVKLARRQTGGGAVFHDLGNTNFTFMAAKPEYDKEVSTSIVLSGLAKLGINGVANGRNDLVLEDEQGIRKFSGSAYRETLDRGFHHGTLLLSADLNRLGDYLNPDEKSCKPKESHRLNHGLSTSTPLSKISTTNRCAMPLCRLTRITIRNRWMWNTSRRSIFRICPDLKTNSPIRAVGTGISARRLRSLIVWMNVLHGVGWRFCWM